MAATGRRASDGRPRGEKPPPRQRLSKEDRRRQIIAVARDVFLRTGFAGARIRELSEAAGVNSALLYQHFESKEALFEASVAEPLEEAIAQLTERGLEAWPSAVGSAANRRQQVAGFIDEILGLMLELAPLLGVMLFADPERGSEFYRTRFAPAIERLTEAVHSADRSWEHREFDARLVVTSGVATCLMLALDSRFGGEMLADRERVTRELTENILLGLEARPDR
jgi:AcrR family transcriptional regulator